MTTDGGQGVKVMRVMITQEGWLEVHPADGVLAEPAQIAKWQEEEKARREPVSRMIWRMAGRPQGTQFCQLPMARERVLVNNLPTIIWAMLQEFPGLTLAGGWIRDRAMQGLVRVQDPAATIRRQPVGPKDMDLWWGGEGPLDATHDAPEDAEFQRFIKWCKDNGGDGCKVEYPGNDKGERTKALITGLPEEWVKSSVPCPPIQVMWNRPVATRNPSDPWQGLLINGFDFTICQWACWWDRALDQFVTLTTEQALADQLARTLRYNTGHNYVVGGTAGSLTRMYKFLGEPWSYRPNLESMAVLLSRCAVAIERSQKGGSPAEVEHNTDPGRYINWRELLKHSEDY